MEVNKLLINKSMNSPRAINYPNKINFDTKQDQSNESKHQAQDVKPIENNEAIKMTITQVENIPKEEDKIKELLEQNEKLEKECLKFKIQIKSMESKVKEASEKNYKSLTNTSSKFILPSEFKQMWDCIAQENLLDTFIDFFDDQVIAYEIVSEFFYLNIELFKENFVSKIRKIFESLKIPLLDQTSLSGIIKFFRPLIEEFYDNIFYDPVETEEYFKSISKKLMFNMTNNNIIKESDSLYDNLRDILESNYFKEFVNIMKKIVLYCEMHEPPLQINIPPIGQRKPIIKFFKSTEIICIDGSPSDDKEYLVLIEPPILKNSYYYMSLKPIVVVYKIGSFTQFDKINNNESNEESNKKILINEQKEQKESNDKKVLTEVLLNNSEILKSKEKQKEIEIEINEEQKYNEGEDIKITPKADFIKLKNTKSELTYSTPNFNQMSREDDKKTYEEKEKTNLKEKLYEKILVNKESSRNKNSIQKYDTSINSFSNLSLQLTYGNNNVTVVPSVNVNANLNNIIISNNSHHKLISSSVTHLRVDRIEKDFVDDNSNGPQSLGIKKICSSNTNDKYNNPSFAFNSINNSTNKKSRQKINYPTYINSFKESRTKVVTTNQQNYNINSNNTLNNDFNTYNLAEYVSNNNDDKNKCESLDLRLVSKLNTNEYQAKNIKMNQVEKKISQSNNSTPNNTTCIAQNSSTNIPLQGKQIMIRVKENITVKQNNNNNKINKPIQIKQISYNYNNENSNSLNKTHSYKNNSNCSNTNEKEEGGLTLNKRQASIDNDRLISFLNTNSEVQIDNNITIKKEDIKDKNDKNDKTFSSSLVTPKNRDSSTKIELLMNSFKKNFSFNNNQGINPITTNNITKESTSPKANFLSQMKKSKTKTHFDNRTNNEIENDKTKITVSTDMLYKLIHLNYSNQLENANKKEINTATKPDFRSTSHHNLLDKNRISKVNSSYKVKNSNVSYDESNNSNKKPSNFINQIKLKKSKQNIINPTQGVNYIALETAGDIIEKRTKREQLLSFQDRSDIPLNTEIVERRSNLNINNSYEIGSMEASNKLNEKLKTSSSNNEDNIDNLIINKIDCETINYLDTNDNNMINKLISTTQTDKLISGKSTGYENYFHEKKRSEGSGYNYNNYNTYKKETTSNHTNHTNQSNIPITSYNKSNIQTNNHKPTKVIRNIQETKAKKDDKVILNQPHNNKISSFTTYGNINTNILQTNVPRRVSTAKKQTNVSSVKTDHKALSKPKVNNLTDNFKVKQTKIIHSIKNSKNKENTQSNKFAASCGFSNNIKNNMNISTLDQKIQFSSREIQNPSQSNHQTIDNDSKEDIDSLVKESNKNYLLNNNLTNRNQSKTPKQNKIKESYSSNLKISKDDISPKIGKINASNYISRDKATSKHNVNLKRYPSHSKDMSDHNNSQQNIISNHLNNKLSSQKAKEINELRKLCSSSLSKERNSPILTNNIHNAKELSENKISPHTTSSKYHLNSSIQGLAVTADNVDSQSQGFSSSIYSNNIKSQPQASYIQNLHSNMNLRKSSFNNSLIASNNTSKSQIPSNLGGSIKIQTNSNNCSTPTMGHISSQQEKKPSKGLFAATNSYNNTNIIKMINKNDSKGRISPNYFNKK